MRKEFDSKLVYDDKYTKTKVKSFNGVIHTNFHDSEAPNEDMNCVCLQLIATGSIMKIAIECYPLYLERCKYLIREQDGKHYRCRIRTRF